MYALLALLVLFTPATDPFTKKYILFLESPCPFVRSFVRSFVGSFIRSFIRYFLCSIVCSFVCSFVRSFVCLFVRSSVREIPSAGMYQGHASCIMYHASIMYHGYMHYQNLHHGFLHQWTFAWVTRLNRPKGVKDEVKQARRSRSRPEVLYICIVIVFDKVKADKMIMRRQHLYSGVSCLCGLCNHRRQLDRPHHHLREPCSKSSV